jgi:hypothetical protein
LTGCLVHLISFQNTAHLCSDIVSRSFVFLKRGTHYCLHCMPVSFFWQACNLLFSPVIAWTLVMANQARLY